MRHQTLPDSQTSSNGASAPDWAVFIFRPLLITGMVACITASWVIVLESTFLDWRGGYLIPLVIVVTMETLVAEQQLRARHAYSINRLQVHLAEMGLMLLVLKPASYLHQGWAAFWNDVPQWFYRPASFLGSGYVLGALVLLSMWGLAMNIAAYLAAVSTGCCAQDLLSGPQDREWGINGLKEQFTVGAILLLLMIGLQRVDLTAIGFKLHPVHVSEMTLLPLVYFGLGLLLFGQARLALLQATWAHNGVPVAPGLGRRWASWGLLFVGGVTALAVLLPAGGTLSGFTILMWSLALAGLVAQIVIFILILLLSLILAPCLFLFQIREPAILRQPELPPLQSSPLTTGGLDWLSLLRVILFWLVIAGVLYLIAKTYWRDRQAIGGWTVWVWLLSQWRNLIAWLRGWTERIEIRLRRRPGEQASQVSTAAPSWWQRWQARTARERVRRFYLTMLQQAAQVGHPRQTNQTPYEYAARLEPHLPEERDALSKLTDAFVEARYSRRAFESQEVSLLRRVWQRLQAALRRV